MKWHEYHEATKHSVESLRRAPHVLDWANMPDPFRHYESVPVLDLPADPPVPETPAFEVLKGVRGATPLGDGNILKRLVVHSGAANLGLLMRKLFGKGTPRGFRGALPAMISAAKASPRLWSAPTTLIRTIRRLVD